MRALTGYLTYSVGITCDESIGRCALLHSICVWCAAISINFQAPVCILSPDFQPIVPAAATFEPNGVLYSPRFGDVYASSEGALAQARHVFLSGNALPARWHNAQRFTIVETGFGAGFNFLATWLAWRAAGSAGRLHFVSVEKHPFDQSALEQAHAHY